jgi:hypothetical protein
MMTPPFFPLKLKNAVKLGKFRYFLYHRMPEPARQIKLCRPFDDWGGFSALRFYANFIEELQKP